LGPLWKDANPDIPILKGAKAEYVICWKQHRPAPWNSVINSVMNGAISERMQNSQPPRLSSGAKAIAPVTAPTPT
jgi:hypothetical protein